MKLIDFHSHILPRLDHGSRSSQVSMNQLRIMADNGVDTVCATSHFYPQEVLTHRYLEARNAAFARLLEVYGEQPRPKIVLGAEVLICEGLDQMDDLDALCLEGTKYLLLEMPFSAGAWTERLFGTVSEIADRGLTPVFAHVDRYPQKLVERLFDMGFTAQINVDSLDRLFKPKRLLRWIDEGVITALGSDLHGDEPQSYAPFIKICESLGDKTAQIMAKTENILSAAIKR